MSERTGAVVLVLLCAGLLWSAFKLGVIGGGGSAAERDKNPISFWIGVSITATMLVLGIAALISTFFF
jgi:hypothetical protein